GCENNYNKAFKGNYSENVGYCSMCDCKNPITGCGWIAEKFGKVKCTSCFFIKKHAAI
ncbi:conserved protein, unknown function, partial [Hepatocystis sp. ex Piliocolobus tephrosceles]